MAQAHTNPFDHFMQTLNAFDVPLKNGKAVLHLLEKNSAIPTKITVSKAPDGDGVDLEIWHEEDPKDTFTVWIHWYPSKKMLIFPYCEGYVSSKDWQELAEFIGKVKSLNERYGNLIRMLAGDEAYAGHFRLNREAMA